MCVIEECKYAYVCFSLSLAEGCLELIQVEMIDFRQCIMYI